MVNLDHANWEPVPKHIRAPLTSYITSGTLPGRFLFHVLSNDLMQAAIFADDVAGAALPQIMRFIAENAPLDAYGAEHKVIAWSNRHKKLALPETKPTPVTPFRGGLGGGNYGP